MSEATCDSCLFWRPVSNGGEGDISPRRYGECREESPYWDEPRWPRTWMDEWCGKHPGRVRRPVIVFNTNDLMSPSDLERLQRQVASAFKGL